MERILSKNNNKYYLAVDLGASSGRHIIGYEENGHLVLDEVYRFHDYLIESNNHLVWDIEKILSEVKNGIKEALRKYPSITSMSIDTWGCDYVLMRGDQEILPCYAYRDSRTEKVINEVHEIIPFSELYSLNGCQFQPFNTIYQLYEDKKSGRLDNVTDFLMIPEYIAYKLTGNKVKEFTNASTTGLMNIQRLEFSKTIATKLGLPYHLFKPLRKSGYEVGHFKEMIARELGGDIKVVLCSSHDTACAVKGIGIPSDTPYLSSGTWSLLGIKVNNPINTPKAQETNYSNELGDNYVRFQKNIMGMWIVNNLAHELDYSHRLMIKVASRSRYHQVFDVNDNRFLATTDIMKDMDEWFIDNGKKLPHYKSDYVNSVYHSLAYSYKVALDELEEITGKKYDCLYIMGGGARNEYVNQLAEEYTKKKIIALPIEATAIGNIMSQMEVEE